MKLPDRPRVFISGAGSGLGRALALELAGRQARLCVSDLTLESARRTAEAATAAGASEVVPFACDVTKPDQVEAAAKQCDERWGGVDLLVNNAGVAAAGKVGDAPLADWEWVVKVNFWGVLHGCHAFVPRMKANGSGAILNVASAASFASLPEMGAYNATKAAVVSLSETLSSELRDDGIQVSVLCPTFFQSDLLSTMRTATADERRKAEAFMQRSKVTSEDIAKAALAGLERGTLHVVPQLDGRALFLLKRWFPSLYFWTLRKSYKVIAERVLPKAELA